MNAILKMCVIFALAASLADATEIVVQGGTSTRTPIIANSDLSNSLKLDSSGGERYSGNSFATYNSIVVVNGESSGNVDIASGGLTIDINKTAGAVTALSAKNWKMNLFALNFTNSATYDATAIANINIAENLSILSSGSAQVQSLNFNNIIANVTVGGTTTVGNSIDGNTSTISVGSDANVTWNGNITFGASGVLNVDGVLESGSLFSFNATSVTTISEGGHLSLSQSTTFGNMDSHGKLTQTTGDGIGFCGNAEINAKSVWNINGKLLVFSGRHVVVNAGASVTMTGNSRIILQGGKITLRENLVGSIALVQSADNSTLAIGADVSLSQINQVSGNILDIIIEDGGILRLTASDSLLNLKGVNVFNFEESKIFVGTNVTLDELSLIKLYAGSDISSYLGIAKLTSEGWLTAIPEPAHWAVVFGAAALMAALYRRRK